MDFTNERVFKEHWRVLTGTEYLTSPLGYHYISSEEDLEKMIKSLLKYYAKEEIKIRKVIEIDYDLSNL